MDPINLRHLENALKKLISFSYFDNSFLHYRTSVANFLVTHDTDEKIKKHLTDLLNSFNSDFELFCKNVKGQLKFYPKKLFSNRKNLPTGKQFYSNDNLIGSSTCESLSIFYELPFDIQIFIMVWVCREGYLLDREISDDNYGNRISYLDDEVNPGRTLIKPYQREFQKWWDKGIQITKDNLTEKNDVTIINFDLKDFYFSIELDFDEVENALTKIDKERSEDDKKLFLLLRKVHETYLNDLLAIEHPALRLGGSQVKYPLPIGLSSSTILANWHLKEFDAQLKEIINPLYYGRYVDDFLIVVNDRILNNVDIPEGKNFESRPEVVFVKKYLSKIFDVTQGDNESEFRISVTKETENEKLKKYSNIRLQPEKFFIYQFAHDLSPNLINKFAEEQKSRSSIFNYLSDDADDFFNDFDENIFEANFDGEDVNKAKFKNLEDNKFRLSVFLTKLINRKIFNEGKYREDELEKIEKYFKGYYLIKHFYFWEKLMTLYIVYGRRDLFIRLIRSIDREIAELKPSERFKLKIDFEVVRRNISDHFLASLRMAVGLNPNFIIDKGFSDLVLIFANKSERDPIERLLRPKTNIDLIGGLKLFRMTGLLRKHHILYPLSQFPEQTRKANTSLFDSSFYSHKENIVPLGDVTVWKWFVPYRVKFYECALLQFVTHVHCFDFTKQLTKEPKYVNEKFLDTENGLEESFDIYCKLNFIHDYDSSYKKQVKESLFQIKPKVVVTESVNKVNQRLEVTEIYIPNTSISPNSKHTTAVVNIDAKYEYLDAGLKGTPVLNEKRGQLYLKILDTLNSVEGLSIFVMPELSLPLAYVPFYSRKCAESKRAMVVGLEHVHLSKVVFNFIYTLLPVGLVDDDDAVPIFRVKNHYAPVEEAEIRGIKLFVPKPSIYNYHLFQWKGLYFTTFYCFEIADIHHRSWPLGLVDAIFMPVWNQDVNYYGSIIDSASRDLHCMIVQSNTSGFGDSRITIPASTIKKDVAKVKGGVEDSYPISLLVHTFDFNSLREFQTWDFNKQKGDKGHEPPFKPTPPDFRNDLAKARMEGRKMSDSL